MNDDKASDIRDELFKRRNFAIKDLQDEIRVDELCRRLLRFFYLDLVEESGLPPAEAGSLANGADYFLREYIIPDRRENIFDLRPGRVRQFAGNWYIIRNMEPNMAELTGILQGIEAFYRYCGKIGKSDAGLVREVEKDCRELDFYRRRIESFWAIEGDGYFAWQRECPLDDEEPTR